MKESLSTESTSVCGYCGQAGAAFLLKCEVCSRHFCNMKQGAGMSHALFHLVRNSHREISVGERVICGKCGMRNVFGLGLAGREMMCRRCYMRDGRDAGWRALIEEAEFIEEVVSKAKNSGCGGKEVSKEEMARIEEGWDGCVLEEEVLSRIVRFSDKKTYMKRFTQLLDMEERSEKKKSEDLMQEGVRIRWERVDSMTSIAHFSLDSMSTSTRYGLGEEVVLSHPAMDFSLSGSVVKSEHYLETFRMSAKVRDRRIDTKITEGFTVRFLFNDFVFKVMRRSIELFARAGRNEIVSAILGKACEKERRMKTRLGLKIPTLPSLNHSQLEAVSAALRRNLTLIQGPPGTGKTLTSAAIVYKLLALKKGPVLVTSPTNVAVDNLTEKLYKCGVRVLRIVSKTREDLYTSTPFATLHGKLAQVSSDRYQKLSQKNHMGEATEEENEEFLVLKRQHTNAIVKEAQVTCCTCSVAGTLKGRFVSVIIDEATQAIEPLTIVPIVSGAERVVLVGDHKQLGPLIINNSAKKGGLGVSLFERLILLGMVPKKLELQYRMHPAIAAWPSSRFYEGALQNGVSAWERSSSISFPWPNPSSPIMFYNCQGREEIGHTGTSFINQEEAVLTERVVSELMRGGVSPSDIAIITPYEGQRVFISELFQFKGSISREDLSEVEIANIDAFQGREKNYVVICMVRSNEDHRLGFSSDYRRINMAMTRARYGLVIIGSMQTLVEVPIWKSLLEYIGSLGAIVEGPISSLRRCVVDWEIENRPIGVDGEGAAKEIEFFNFSELSKILSSVELPQDFLG
jgi:regulator of nonsense transcripts 1